MSEPYHIVRVVGWRCPKRCSQQFLAFRINHNVVENSFELGYQVPHEALEKVLRSSNQ